MRGYLISIRSTIANVEITKGKHADAMMLLESRLQVCVWHYGPLGVLQSASPGIHLEQWAVYLEVRKT